MAADPLDLPALVAAMNESAYSGCASFYPEAGTICTERGRDLALWCDRCLLREAAAALATLAADRDQQARRADEAEKIVAALVEFQSLYQRNVIDSAPGNEHYAGLLLAIVDAARGYFGLPARPTVHETMDERE